MKDGEKPDWIELGAAWEHADKKGYDVVLKVLPVGGLQGRVTLGPSKRKPARAKRRQRSRVGSRYFTLSKLMVD